MCSVSLVLGIELRTSHMLSKYSTTEFYPAKAEPETTVKPTVFPWYFSETSEGNTSVHSVPLEILNYTKGVSNTLCQNNLSLLPKHPLHFLIFFPVYLECSPSQSPPSEILSVCPLRSIQRQLPPLFSFPQLFQLEKTYSKVP